MYVFWKLFIMQNIFNIWEDNIFLFWENVKLSLLKWKFVSIDGKIFKCFLIFFQNIF